MIIYVAVIRPKNIAEENQRQYENAIELYNSGDYQAAQDAFAELGEYENSSDMVQNSIIAEKYSNAMNLFDAGDKYAVARYSKNADQIRTAEDEYT